MEGDDKGMERRGKKRWWRGWMREWDVRRKR